MNEVQQQKQNGDTNLKAGEQILSEVGEKIVDVFERSNEWIECLVIAAGSFFLILADKAPEEMEVIGIKVQVHSEHRVIFIAIFGLALAIRLIQNWALMNISVHRIGVQFAEIVEALKTTSIDLVSKADELDKTVNQELDKLLESSKLPSVHTLFGTSEITDAVVVNGDVTFPVFSLSSKQVRDNVDELLKSRWQVLKSSGLSDWYPTGLWHQAAKATVDLCVAEHQSIVPRTAISWVSTAQNNGETKNVCVEETDEKLRQLRDAQIREMQKLEKAIELRRQESPLKVKKLSSAMRSLVIRINRFRSRAVLYHRLLSIGRYAHLTLATSALVFAGFAILSSAISK